MRVDFLQNGAVRSIDADTFTVPFLPENFGFFIQRGEERLNLALCGTKKEAMEKLVFSFFCEVQERVLKIHIRIENTGDDFDGRIGFHMGVDTYMDHYPQWNEKFFPTLLRCEKTHLWGYYMNTAEQALAVATEGPVASYDIQYNMAGDDQVHCGHRIPGTDILFYQNTMLPERHPQNLKIMKAGEVYTNTIYMIPVSERKNIKPTLAKIAGIPLVEAEKYTLEPGEILDAQVLTEAHAVCTLYGPDGSACEDPKQPLKELGLYLLRVKADNGKQCEASFFVRREWDYYLKCAAENAWTKPFKASTHTESFYGFFSAFLYYKHSRDEEFGKKIYAAFDEAMPYMFDMERCVPITIPNRIQNTAGLISVLVDMYEADPVHQLSRLEKAGRFAEVLMKNQDADGAYRNKRTHYTCVIYIAKSMLELALAERACGVKELEERAEIHYQSAKRAVDELVKNLDNIETEGEMTLEDGMISCSALQIGMFALTLPKEEREPYIRAAEYMIKVHSCLEQQLIPDCRCNGASLRYWESQYDVMIRVNMLNSPHGWTGWTAYAKYYLYMLTGKKEYLQSLNNIMGGGAQLIDENGNLRWAFCSQPYVKGRAFVPDTDAEVTDGYAFVEAKEKAYRGKYVMGEFSEQYIDMISGWYRVGEQKVTGGYEFCPLILDGYSDYEADTQGGCCDNDVHELFKCMEETVLGKAFVHEDENGSFFCVGCTAKLEEGNLCVEMPEGTKTLVYNLTGTYKLNGEELLHGFGTIC